MLSIFFGSWDIFCHERENRGDLIRRLHHNDSSIFRPYQRSLMQRRDGGGAVLEETTPSGTETFPHVRRTLG